MATSGTIGQTTFTTRQVVDHAFRRCRLVPQQITGESIQTAQDLLWMILSNLNQRGIALWAVAEQFIGLVENVPQTPLKVGTLDVFNINLRQLTRLTGTATATSGAASLAFDGDLATSTTQAFPGGNIALALTTASVVTMVGVCPNATATWGFTIQTSSNSGSSWTTRVTASEQAVSGQWLWYAIQGATDETTNVRIVANGTTTLSVKEFVVGNNTQDITISKIDRDSYATLPNKQFVGRPVQCWYDRQRDAQYLWMWPAPAQDYTITYCVQVYAQRQLQDVGALTQTLDIPQRWYLPIVADLARNLAMEIKEVDPQLVPTLEASADRLLNAAWNGESDGATARLLPNIGVYNA